MLGGTVGGMVAAFAAWLLPRRMVAAGGLPVSEDEPRIEKVRENRLRRAAARQGLVLRKSRFTP